jgi:hypothetical protein
MAETEAFCLSAPKILKSGLGLIGVEFQDQGGRVSGRKGQGLCLTES